MAVEAAPANRRDGGHARRAADETRRRAFEGAGRLASGHIEIRRREGRYLLRTNLSDNDPAQLWQYYTQLVAIEEAFRNLKGDLAIRPVFHQDEKRIEAHIFIAFLAYCMQITLTRRLHALAPGLTARSALEKFAAVQMIDVHLPTTDGREILLTRYTHPEPELQLLIDRLKLRLPPQPPPRITTAAVTQANRRSEDLLT
ncbi:transposase [Bradyrhizobium sp. 183]|nr:transposase [Bradyrhizobium sp. 184]UPJ87555.1 transposase [Bradyrhizobium sp. 183]